MTKITLDDDQLKLIVKQALRELIQEDKEMFSDLVAEIVEDMALVNAIKEGEKTENVSRDAIFKILNRNYEN